MLAWEKFGNGETPESTGLKGDKLVGNYYVKFDQEYKKEVTKYKFDDLYNAFTEFIQKEIDKGIFPTFTTITGKSVEIFEINTQGSIRARAKGSITNKVAPLTQENIEKLYNKYKYLLIHQQKPTINH